MSLPNPESPRRRVSWWQPALTVAILFVLAWATHRFLRQRGGDLRTLLELDPLHVAALVAGMLLFFAFLGSILAQLAAALGARLDFVEWYTITLGSNFAAYLLPIRPGIALKAAYLKTVHGVSLTRYSALFATQTFLLFFISGTLTLGLLLWHDLGENPFALLLYSGCFAMLVLSLLPAWVILRRGEARLAWLPARLAERLDAAAVGFREIWRQPRALFGVTVALVAQYLVAAGNFTLAFHALDLEVPYATVLLVGVFSSIANLASVTPNNLGVLEVVVASLYSAVGYDFSTGLLGAALVRAVHLVVVVAATPVFTSWLVARRGVSWRRLFP